MALPKSHNYDPKHVFDIMVIGSGIAGMAASLFSINRKLSTVQAGSAGGTLFTSGVLDLMAIHPIEEKKVWSNPWEAIAALRDQAPLHPYARISDEDIHRAFEEMVSFLNSVGMNYRFEKSRNVRLITSMGTIKHTYCVPESMWHCIKAHEEKAPCLIIDFNGLREFSGRQISSTLQNEWPLLRSLRVSFPGTEGLNEIHPVHLAQALELSPVRESLAARILPEIRNVRYAGFPAVLGIKKTPAICAHLEKLLGVPVFEIPMMPASVPGFRLKEVFDSSLPPKGLLRLIDKRVESVTRLDNGNFILNIGGPYQDQFIQARGVILATGRFLGKGLMSDRKEIFEPLFRIPVWQPANRVSWHRERFLDPSGHPINSAGIEVDDSFRAVDGTGKVIYDNLFIAGSILAHQDWIRMKCGSGLAFATAYAAVNAFINNFVNSSGRVTA
jgi:glycerol-3-phosphate dehydrogenase subunit B